VLATLFVVGAVANMTIFQRNRRRRYKFLFSFLIFAFCMARVVALSLRCAWAAHQRNVRLAIASQVLTSAGVLILFVTNLVFAQRVVRAWHPFFGWSKPVTAVFGGLFVSAFAVLVMVVTVTVHSFFVTDEKVRALDHRVQLFCTTYLAVFAILPVVLVALAVVVPRRTRIDKFGEGHFRTKFALLAFTATLLSVGAIFRAVVNFYSRPVAHPAWFHGKAPYYCFNFAIELIVVYVYALSRIDKRFHIPDGACAPGHYSFGNAGTDLVSNGEAERRRRDKNKRGGNRPGEKHGSGESTCELWSPPPAKMSDSARSSTLKSMRSSGGLQAPSQSSNYDSLKRASESSLVRQQDMQWMDRAMVRIWCLVWLSFLL
jgi:hypothetical protein